jgi:hypothetical protein
MLQAQHKGFPRLTNLVRTVSAGWSLTPWRLQIAGNVLHPLQREDSMHLTLDEVIDRIRKGAVDPQDDHRNTDTRTKENPHRPEVYVPRVTRRIANFLFST